VVLTEAESRDAGKQLGEKPAKRRKPFSGKGQRLGAAVGDVGDVVWRRPLLQTSTRFTRATLARVQQAADVMDGAARRAAASGRPVAAAVAEAMTAYFDVPEDDAPDVGALATAVLDHVNMQRDERVVLEPLARNAARAMAYWVREARKNVPAARDVPCAELYQAAYGPFLKAFESSCPPDAMQASAAVQRALRESARALGKDCDNVVEASLVVARALCVLLHSARPAGQARSGWVWGAWEAMRSALAVTRSEFIGQEVLWALYAYGLGNVLGSETRFLPMIPGAAVAVVTLVRRIAGGGRPSVALVEGASAAATTDESRDPGTTTWGGAFARGALYLALRQVFLDISDLQVTHEWAARALTTFKQTAPLAQKMSGAHALLGALVAGVEKALSDGAGQLTAASRTTLALFVTFELHKYAAIALTGSLASLAVAPVKSFATSVLQRMFGRNEAARRAFEADVTKATAALEEQLRGSRPGKIIAEHVRGATALMD
jgi:hypothetical protein